MSAAQKNTETMEVMSMTEEQARVEAIARQLASRADSLSDDWHDHVDDAKRIIAADPATAQLAWAMEALTRGAEQLADAHADLSEAKAEVEAYKKSRQGLSDAADHDLPDCDRVSAARFQCSALSSTAGPNTL